jgi:hypothetical protein
MGDSETGGVPRTDHRMSTRPTSMARAPAGAYLHFSPSDATRWLFDDDAPCFNTLVFNLTSSIIHGTNVYELFLD